MALRKIGYVLVLEVEKCGRTLFEICDICESDINLPLNIRFTGEEAVDHGWSKITKVFRGKVSQTSIMIDDIFQDPQINAVW